MFNERQPALFPEAEPVPDVSHPVSRQSRRSSRGSKASSEAGSDMGSLKSLPRRNTQLEGAVRLNSRAVVSSTAAPMWRQFESMARYFEGAATDRGDSVKEKIEEKRRAMQSSEPVEAQSDEPVETDKLEEEVLEKLHDASKNPSPLDGQDSDEEHAHTHASCGYLLDQIRRKGVGIGLTTRQLIKQLGQGDFLLYEYTRSAVLRDEFFCMVWDVITNFYKDPVAIKAVAGPSGEAWPKSTTADIVKMIRGIVAEKRRVVCFKTEVHNWILKSKLLNAHVPVSNETLYERFNRMEEFWSHYHKRLRRNELPPINTSNRLPAAMGATGSGWRAAMSPKKPGKRPMCFADAEQWSMIEQIEERSRPDRGHRGRPSSSSQKNAAKLQEDADLSPKGGDDSPSSASCQPSPKSKTPVGLKTASPLLRRCATEPTLKGSPSSSSLLSPKGKVKLTLPSLNRAEKDQAALGGGPTSSYLEACQRCWIVPTPLPFVTGHSWSLHAAGRNMMDNDLRAVAPVLQEVGSIDEIDLSGNVMLSEKALVPFFERLYGEPASSSLHTLTLRDVKHIGIQSMEVIRSLISAKEGVRCLRKLDLCHVHITPRCHLKLAKAVQDHLCIETINLADTGLGSNTWIAKQCVSLLMPDTVRNLDIGWNSFDSEVFKQLGENLVTKRIEFLSVSNCCAGYNLNIPSPISFFLETLSRDKTLTSLDVSLNRMDFREMLIVEDAMALHKKLNRLDISQNPMGILGMRSALRLLNKNTNVLVHFVSTGCYSGSVMGQQTFNMCNPGGKYSLDLSRPYHRSIVRMLYKLVAKYKLFPEQAFTGLQYSKGWWTHSQVNEEGRCHLVHREGNVTFTFHVDNIIENCITGIDKDDFSGFIDAHRKLTKITPSWNKVIPMFACWKELDGNSKDQSAFLEAMSKDFCLLPSHLEHMCTSSTAMRCEVIDRLLPCVVGGEASESLVMQLFQSLPEFARMHREMRAMIDFNTENPTGHYKLDLASSSEYSVAEKLLLLDRWEVVLAKRAGRKDTSQRGNHSHIRNERYNHQPLHLITSEISEWTLPEADCFECDYVTGRRCPRDAVIISDAHFNNILVCIFGGDCTPMQKIEVLRMLSNHLYLTAYQLRELLGAFKLAEHRAEVFVTFFLRVKDMWNAKVFQVRFADNKAECKRLMDRLGYATVYPFIQPENMQVELNYDFSDQKLCANILLQLAGKEGPHNVKEPSFVWPNGTVDPFPLGVPRSWEVIDKMPKAGIFTGTYSCAPENRKFATRAWLAETYGYFPMQDVQESEVLWWTGLTEVTEDVLDWLEFCLSRFKTMDDAFTAIDGPDGNGQISLREFEEGVKELQCKKFKGKDEQQRISALFRYLDPGGEGSVSRAEWGVMEQLYREFNLCIQEFVQYLQRLFGSDLADAWNFLDDDGSGELTFDEWMQAVQGIGYFGPAKCVFGLIDSSDDGSISTSEFQAALAKYVKAEEPSE